MKKLKLILTLLISISLSMCSSENDLDKIREELKSLGYTEIIGTGYDFFCCDSENIFSTGFTAKDKNGNLVEGCACSDFLSGVTIRFK